VVIIMWRSDHEIGYEQEGFAGDLFLKLAVEGRLVLDADQADQMIAALEATLDTVGTRSRLVELWRKLPRPAFHGFSPAAEQVLVDAVFIEQVAPGQMERVLLELPKYVEAFKLAKKR
jgi:hypothetical protein